MIKNPRLLIDASNLTGLGSRAVLRGIVPPLSDMLGVAGQQAFVWLPGRKAPIDIRELRRGSVNPSEQLPAARQAKPLRYIRRSIHLSRDPVRRCTERPDVALVLGDFASLGLSVPYVLLAHNVLPVTPPNEVGQHSWSSLKWAVMSRVFATGARRASVVVVQTPLMAERVHMHAGVVRNRLRVIAMPGNVDLMDPAGHSLPESVLHTDPDRCSLLFPAAGYPHKNHNLILAIAEILSQRSNPKPRFYVTIPRGSRLDRRLGRFPEIVTNLGELSPRDVITALHECDALFFPSHVETVGLPLLEAAALGKPILAADRPYARWVLGDAGATFFDPTDAAAAIAAIDEFRAADTTSKTAGPERTKGAGYRPCTWDEVARRLLDACADAASEW